MASLVSKVQNCQRQYETVATQQKSLAAAESSKRYCEKRSIIQENLRQKDYWPEGITHPNNFRKFYVAQDLSYCGFAQNEDEIGKKRQAFVQ